MPRYMPGENTKIDRINDLVRMARCDDPVKSSEGLKSLLSLFKPMILKLCGKWSSYFNDENHRIVSWDVLLCDAYYWFIEYTINKYDVDGPATYNKFIKDHMDQRIRYIYECELNYYKRNIFPDPDKNNIDNDTDMLESVIFNYSDTCEPSFDDLLVDKENRSDRENIARMILSLVDDRRYITQREALIFHQCIIHCRTHEDVANELGISRARVSQVIGKIKKKVKSIIEEELGGLYLE